MIVQSSKLPSWLLVAATLFIVRGSGCVSPYASNPGNTQRFTRVAQDGRLYHDGPLESPGSWYKGQMNSYRQLHGQGTLTFPSGQKYIGQFQNGKKHGQGTHSWPDGRKYVGQWRDGKMHGEGTYTYANGEKYIGQFQDSKLHGQGTFTWPDGREYVGQWRGHATIGGTLTHPDGRMQRGRWVNDVFVEEPGRAVGQKPPGCRLSDLPEVESQQSVAVLDFQVSEDLQSSVGQSLADLCRDSVMESGRFVLIERENMKTILDEEDFTKTFDCDNTKCLVDFGKKLSAQKIIHGRVSKVGTSFLITIKILNVSSTEVEGLKTAKVSGGLEQVLDFVQPVTCEILRKSLTGKP